MASTNCDRGPRRRLSTAMLRVPRRFYPSGPEAGIPTQGKMPSGHIACSDLGEMPITKVDTIF
jgi:hypothetical protein